MANKYTKTPIPFRVKEQYESGKTQQQIADTYNTTQKVVWRWLRDLKVKCRVPKNNNQNGEKNPAWKKEKAGYAAMHYRVSNQRGKPNICVRCGTKTAKRYEWASLTKDYKNVNDYIRLCKSCHLKFDTFRSSQGWAVSKEQSSWN